MPKFSLLRSACFVVLPLLILPAGCDTTGNSAKGPAANTATGPVTPPEPPVLRVGPEGSKPVAFHRIIINIPQGQSVGELRYSRNGRVIDTIDPPSVNEGGPAFGQITREELHNAGYTVRGMQSVVFDDDEAAKTRYQLGAEITKLKLNVYNNTWTGVIEVEGGMSTKFQVYDTYARRVVYEREESVEHFSKDKKENDFLSMYRKTVRRFLAEQEFFDLMTGDGKPGENTIDAYEEKLTITVNEKPLLVALPGGFNDLLKAVVVVEQGFTGGSGFIISPDGYVLTCAHVISDKDEVRVKFNSGLELNAEVVRVNSAQDVALLKLQGRGHNWLPLDAIDVAQLTGQDVFAVGHPLSEELGFSVSKGVVSGFRQFDEQQFIQMDASINQGNSGGPILTPEGKIVGMASWKAFGEGIEGLSFAIPVERVLRALNLEIMKEQK